MNKHQLFRYFIESLNSIYPEYESESIFFLLLEEKHHVNRLKFNSEKEMLVSHDEKKEWETVIEQLKVGRPIQHILGYGYCYERQFIVNEHTLIPRMETEELIHLILKDNLDIALNVLDIGTGTGCIAINLAEERKSWNVSAVDVSEKALLIANENKDNLGAKVKFNKFDILKKEQWSAFESASLDIIVSNPPYVMSSEKQKMHTNVLNFEPHLALFVSDEEPLLFYQTIIEFASLKLKSGAKLYFEINEQFSVEVATLFSEYAFEKIVQLKDLQSKDRIVYAEKL
ncbi:MAG: peptide chain release factor N(5)-glutamine methyltransferase [Bacteroidales bacterium]|nr:peptide chain release factor N(5)-glutamine methyltransferase [Bacteroidales bacterium]